ncbi:MAG TPA: MATE family efflux transporter [Polyangiaceae bacterium]|nr:MATE family efflux transporter [Polyangiaceae bacterium]
MALPPSVSTKALVTLASGSPVRVILKLAMPTVFAMLTQSAVNEVDIIFFSHLPCPESSTAQAALLPSLILLWMFGGSLSAISVGTQAISARRFAEGKSIDAGAVLVNSWVCSLLASIVFTGIGYLVMPHALHALIRVPEVREAAQGYLNWRLLGITSMAVTFSFKAFFDGIGKTHVHMVASVVMNVINVLLCIALIFGYWGAPRMGMAGAGLAGAASSWVGLLIMVAWATLSHYRINFRPFDLARVVRTLMTDILRLSVPSAVATVAVMSGFALFSGIVSHLDSVSHAATLTNPDCPGGRAEAVNGAATALIVGVLKLTFTACLAFGTSTATLVSQSLGAGQPDKAARFGWVSVRLGLLIFGAVGLLEGVFLTKPLLHLVTQSPAVFETALVPMRMMGLCTPLIAVGMILTQALFGAGNTRFVMLVELVLHFFCLVPLAWLFGITLGLGLPGIWASAAIYVLLLTGVMTWKFRRGDWKTISI